MFLLYGIYSYPLFSLDEVRYAETAREMIERHDYITPYCNYVLRPEKPIFFYWLEILSFKAFGLTEFAARLPSVLMGVFSVLVVFLAAEFFSFGIYAALILLTSIEFAVVAKLSITDMTLGSFMTACILSLFFAYHFSDFDRKRTRLFLLLASVFAALGFLTKGPVALALPGLIFAVFLVLKVKLFCFCRGYWREILLALAAFLLIALPWFVAVHLATDGEFTQRFFFQENVNRFLQVQTGHDAVWFYYVPVFLIGFLPWTFFVPQAFRDTLVYVFKSQDQEISSLKDLLFYCLIWFAVILVFFSLAQTKLTTYIISVFPPAALILAAWFQDVRKSKKLGIIVGLTLFCLAGFVIYFVRTFFQEALLKLDQDAFASEILFFGVIVALASVLALFLCAKNHIKYAFYTIVVAMIFAFCYVTETMIKPISFYRDSGTKEFMQNLKAEDQIVSYGIPPERFEFYGERQVPRYRDKKLKKYLQSHHGQHAKYIVCKTKDLDKINKLAQREDLNYSIKTSFYSIVRIN